MKTILVGAPASGEIVDIERGAPCFVCPTEQHIPYLQKTCHGDQLRTRIRNCTYDAAQFRDPESGIIIIAYLHACRTDCSHRYIDISKLSRFECAEIFHRAMEATK
jgi:hypothetical protein